MPPRSTSPRTDWLLVTGAPRSGTSLLRALLCEHPSIGLLQEYGLTDLIGRIDAIVDRPAPAQEDWDSAVDEADTAYNAALAFYRDRPDRDAVTRGGGDPQPAHFHAVAAGLFSGLFPGKPQRIVGDKMPIAEVWENVPLLFERLPGFRILAIIRNPAAVVRSSLVRRASTRRGRDTWPIATVDDAVAQWIDAWQRVTELVRRYGGGVMVVKYEDLCTATVATMADIVAWLDLPAHMVRTPIASLPEELALHSAAEQATVERALLPLIKAWPTTDAASLLTTFGSLRQPDRLGDRLDFSHEDASRYLVSGFSLRDASDRWTDGPKAVLSIPHGLSRGLLLIDIRIAQAFSRPDEPCHVVVQCDWRAPKLFTLDEGRSRIAIVTRAEESLQPEAVRVEFTILRPKTTEELPDDSRALGILIESIRITDLTA